MQNDNIRSRRKDAHVEHVLKQEPVFTDDFGRVHLIHQSIPKYDLSDIDLSAEFGSFNWRTPIYINAMTGGSEWTKSINGKLAQVAKETGLPMALGSMHAAIKDPSLKHTFTIARDINPNGFLMANIGADVPLEGAEQTIQLVDAQALQIHVNAAQELIMPEGERVFKSWLSNIENIIKHVDVPVIVKEVGFDMSQETMKELYDIGVKHIDISGRGGTNFAVIENQRRAHQEMDYMSSWGQSTVITLLESKSYQHKISVLASGGVITPLDAVKCLVLGAEAVGMSKNLLEHVMHHGVDETVQYVENFIYQMKKISVLINSQNIKEIQQSPRYLDQTLTHWLRQRVGMSNE